MATRVESFASESRPVRLNAHLVERIASALVIVGVLAAIVFGWLNRDADWINPEHGFGYALGIVGGTMMLVLLAYPLRKRSRSRGKKLGSVGFWFRFHMLLGLLGPLAILYHSRFTWGALNSAVALGAMIIVAGSGLIGRFLYSRVHRGYSDRKLEMRSLKQEMESLLNELEAHGLPRDEISKRLLPFEHRAVSAGATFWSSAVAVIVLGVETRRAERRFRRALGKTGRKNAKASQAAIALFFEAVRRAAEFAFYDRLLRLWHLLHMPLFLLLVGAAILHIVAVHMY